MNTPIEVTSETRVVHGIRLPWQRIEKTGPMTGHNGVVFYADAPPKGTVLESGEVFVPFEVLEELAEQGEWDSQFGSAFLLGVHEGLALEQVGFAVQETRGGYHRTDALVEFLNNRYASADGPGDLGDYDTDDTEEED